MKPVFSFFFFQELTELQNYQDCLKTLFCLVMQIVTMNRKNALDSVCTIIFCLFVYFIFRITDLKYASGRKQAHCAKAFSAKVGHEPKD